MWSILDRLRDHFALMSSKPDALRIVLQEQLKSQPAEPTGKISRSFDEAIAEIGKRGYRRVAVYGGAEFRDRSFAALPQAELTWLSHSAVDQLAGARSLADAAPAANEAILVGGADVKLAYPNLLRSLAGASAVPDVLWVGEQFEYCFSTLPVPAEASDVDLYLFHHFDMFFSVKDALLVRVRAEDRKRRVEIRRIVRSRETLKLSLQELLPEREGPAFVECYTSHPQLTRGRHRRWRLSADVFWGDSLTTLHGAHDDGPAHLAQSRIARSLVDHGRLSVTIPNYERDLAPESAEALGYLDDQAQPLERNNDRPLEELQWAQAVPAPGYFSYLYKGYGTSFFFGMCDPSGTRKKQTIFANHEGTVSHLESVALVDAEAGARLADLESLGLVLHPHALPITAPSEPVEFGFSFASASPRCERFTARFFDAAGGLLGTRAITVPSTIPLYGDELVARLGEPLAERPRLAVLAPDWRQERLDPRRFNMVGDLLMRNRETGDFDLTEFQSCWRNLGMTVEGFPHWLHDANAIVGRTKMLARAVLSDRLRTGVLLANGSGNLGHRRTARVEVQLFEPGGRSRSVELELPAFSHRLLFVDEAFADAERFLGGYGTLVVQSADADLNCQLLTLSSQGGVSLQHLWGY